MSDDRDDDEKVGELSLPGVKINTDDPQQQMLLTMHNSMERGFRETRAQLLEQNKQAQDRHVEYIEVNTRQDGQIRKALAVATNARKEAQGADDRVDELAKSLGSEIVDIRKKVNGGADEPGTLSSAIVASIRTHEKKHEGEIWFANLPSLLWKWRANWKSILASFVLMVWAAIYGGGWVVQWFKGAMKP